MFAAKHSNDQRLSAIKMFSTGYTNGRKTRNDPSGKTILTATASHTVTNW